jgi:hypothetical protein
MKTLILSDWPCYNYLSQIVPLAKCFGRSSQIGIFAANPVTLHMMNSIPFIDFIHCIKLTPKAEQMELSLISKTEGMNAPIDYFFLGDYFPGQCGTPPQDMKVVISQEVFDIINSYNQIVLVYDGAFNQTISFFEQILNEFKHKTIGRVGQWNSDCKKFDDDKYYPQEIVEAFGFQWQDNLMSLDLSWYKDYDPGWPVFESKTIGLTWSAGCESYMPINEEKTYYRVTKLTKLFAKKGFKVISTNRNDDVRKQIHLRCQYHIIVDSIAAWTSKCFYDLNIFLISEDNPKLEKKLGLKNILVGHKSLRDVEPEEIIDSFLNKVSKI